MRVITARANGMCFGVKNALETLSRIESPGEVTIYGELVHNPEVLAGLGRRGFPMAAEADRGVPATPAVLVTAHGVSDRQRALLLAAGKTVVDTTCPLVRRAHLAARGLAREGRHVIVIGRPGHVEVRGLTGDLPGFDVVEGPEDVRRWPHPRLGVIAQTTTPEDRAKAVLRAVAERNPDADVRYVDTVCRPTKDRQAALRELLARVQLLVVVGGRNSNNTRELAASARDAGIPALHVTGAADLHPLDFDGVEVVGLTAGTSTPPETVAAVRRALLQIGRSRRRAS
jgi:4-hydroxy-3-methylbut-2-enyl diphosphate reductase